MKARGGAGTWLSLEGEDAWSEPFQVPAVVSFQINIYSRAGLWLGHTESASVLPQHSLTLSHSLVNVPMIKFNFFSSGKGEWAEIDMTILKADEHPTPLSTQYLQLPGSLLLPGSLGGDDHGLRLRIECLPQPSLLLPLFLESLPRCRRLRRCWVGKRRRLVTGCEPR